MSPIWNALADEVRFSVVSQVLIFISPETKLGKLEGWNAEEFIKGTHKTYTLIVNGKEEQNVTILHLDVDSLSEKRKMISPYETSSLMFKLYSKMSEFFLEKK